MSVLGVCLPVLMSSDMAHSVSERAELTGGFSSSVLDPAAFLAYDTLLRKAFDSAFLICSFRADSLFAFGSEELAGVSLGCVWGGSIVSSSDADSLYFAIFCLNQ